MTCSTLFVDPTRDDTTTRPVQTRTRPSLRRILGGVFTLVCLLLTLGCSDDSSGGGGETPDNNTPTERICQEHADCNGGEVCRDNVCRFACEGDDDCATGVCDGTASYCVECLAHDDCGENEACVGKSCQFFCTEDDACGTGEYCASNGECEMAECEEALDCAGGFTCRNHQCVSIDAPALECEPNTSWCGRNHVITCNGEGTDQQAMPCGTEQRCVETNNSASCVSGSCEPQCGALECGPDPTCGVSCGTCTGGATCSFGGQCVQPSGCDTNEDCASGETCDNGACVAEAFECTTSLECAFVEQGLGCVDGACAPCTNGDHCALGICLEGVCLF